MARLRRSWRPGESGATNVADVFNSIINMVGTATTIVVILLSPSLARTFGKKAVAVAGFALSTVNAFAFYLLKPDSVGGMVALTITGSLVYAPTIPLVWAIFADVADFSEWQTGRRFTGIGFCHHWFRPEIRARDWLGFVPLGHVGLVRLRHEISGGRECRGRLPRVRGPVRRCLVCDLHGAADRVQVEQDPHGGDGGCARPAAREACGGR